MRRNRATSNRGTNRGTQRMSGWAYMAQKKRLFHEFMISQDHLWRKLTGFEGGKCSLKNVSVHRIFRELLNAVFGGMVADILNVMKNIKNRDLNKYYPIHVIKHPKKTYGACTPEIIDELNFLNKFRHFPSGAPFYFYHFLPCVTPGKGVGHQLFFGQPEAGPHPLGWGVIKKGSGHMGNFRAISMTALFLIDPWLGISGCPTMDQLEEVCPDKEIFLFKVAIRILTRTPLGQVGGGHREGGYGKGDSVWLISCLIADQISAVAKCRDEWFPTEHPVVHHSLFRQFNWLSKQPTGQGPNSEPRSGDQKLRSEWMVTWPVNLSVFSHSMMPFRSF